MTDMPIRPHLLTLEQVAIIIMVHPRTVRNYITEGKLKGHNPNGNLKGLRVTVESVRAYLRTHLLAEFRDADFEETLHQAVEKAPVCKPVMPRPSRGSGWVKRW